MNNHVVTSKRKEKHATHLKLEKPRLRFLEGSAGASVAPVGASADDPATGGSAPASRFGSATTPSTPSDGGATASHLLELVRSPHSPRQRASLPAPVEGTGPAAHTVDSPHCDCRGTPTSESSFHSPGLRVPLQLLHSAVSGLRPGHQRIHCGDIDTHCLPLDNDCQNKPTNKEAKGDKMVLTWPVSGSITNEHRSSSLCCTAFGLISHLTRVAAYPWASGSSSSRECAKDTG
jgi:hypothetical protein